MTAIVMLRFDEADNIRPKDERGNLGDLDEGSGGIANPPTRVEAALGRAVQFEAGDETGLIAQDVVPGATLLTRDMSWQAFLSIDASALATGTIGTLYARGLGTGAAEYASAIVEVRSVNQALRVLELRWAWHDTAGVLHTQIGGHFQSDAKGEILLTATRRWVSSTSVVLRYYIGDLLLSEVTTVDGSIGGGTTGTTTIGTRYDPPHAAFNFWLSATIDEMRIVDYELTAEEIAATYARVTTHQPAGYQLLRELHDPGFPISESPESDVQLETRQWGHALGFAAAQGENLRANLLPDHAYGDVLAQWEAITKQPPKPGDSVETRRARVLARLAQRSGASIPGITAALRQLLGLAASQIQVIGFDQTIRDDFAAGINALRWRLDPAGPPWSSGGGVANLTSAAAATVEDHTWPTMMLPVGGNGNAAHMITKITRVATTAGAEAGVAFGDWAHGNYILAGLRWNGATFDLYTEIFASNVSTGAAVSRALGLVGPVWLHLYADDKGLAPSLGFGNQQTFNLGWSTTSGAGPFALATGIIAPWYGVQWAALYGRTVGGAATLQMTFDDVAMRAPYGTRSFHWYVYRDPTLPGAYDIAAAENIARSLRQAHTTVHVVTTKTALFDDASTTFDSAPMGAI